eukprot:g5038.t1
MWWLQLTVSHEFLAPYLAPEGPGMRRLQFLSVLLNRWVSTMTVGTVLYHMNRCLSWDKTILAGKDKAVWSKLLLVVLTLVIKKAVSFPVKWAFSRNEKHVAAVFVLARKQEYDESARRRLAFQRLHGGLKDFDEDQPKVDPARAAREEAHREYCCTPRRVGGEDPKVKFCGPPFPGCCFLPPWFGVVPWALLVVQVTVLPAFMVILVSRGFLGSSSSSSSSSSSAGRPGSGGLHDDAPCLCAIGDAEDIMRDWVEVLALILVAWLFVNRPVIVLLATIVRAHAAGNSTEVV